MGRWQAIATGGIGVVFVGHDAGPAADICGSLDRYRCKALSDSPIWGFNTNPKNRTTLFGVEEAKGGGSGRHLLGTV